LKPSNITLTDRELKVYLTHKLKFNFMIDSKIYLIFD
jgi:hypothetical protein